MQRFGAPYYGIHRADLQKTLSGAFGVREPAPGLPAGQHRRASATAVVLEFANGRVEHADLVVGADGVRSTVRRWVTGADDAVYSGTSAFRGIVPTENLPSLPDPHAIQFWMGPDAHLLHYAIGGHGEVGQLLRGRGDPPDLAARRPRWSTSPDEVPVASFRGWHPAVTEMIRAAASPIRWALFGVRPLLRWYRGRVVILGDAAHGMLPHHGQGANTSIEDAFALAALLTEPDRTISRARSPSSRCCVAPAPARSSAAPGSPVACSTCPTDRRRRRATRRWPGSSRTSGGSTNTTYSGRCTPPGWHRPRPRKRALSALATRSPTGEDSMTQDEVLAGVAEVLGRIAKVDPVNVGAEQTFADLGIDSVTMVDVVVAAEDRFGVMLLDDDWSQFTNVGDAVGYIQQLAATGPTGATQPAR